ncbi:hypothetical protein [Bifidobacterium bifidum]|uniref:hypothetical protein n=1 Tax=Bifidobacterium bifidum TaxID=1681 RepID=UPI001651AD7F|nr:hypothetical protein [Bifidobacterium bifidum]
MKLLAQCADTDHHGLPGDLTQYESILDLHALSSTSAQASQRIRRHRADAANGTDAASFAGRR